MKKIWQEAVFPLLRRVGSIAAGVLVANGLDAETSRQVVELSLAVAAVGFDLVVSHIERKKR